MSLRERRGNMLSVPTKAKRTESYFALPVSLRNNTETALAKILTIGKEALNGFSSKFWEFINPTVQPNIQVNIAKSITEGEEAGESAQTLPFKRKNEDNYPVCVKKRAVLKESVEVQTDPYVVMKVPARTYVARNPENAVKGLDLFGDMETKGTDDDEEDLVKGKKRIKRGSKQKIWIQRGPYLEIIPEKLNEGGKDKKLSIFAGLEKKENFIFNAPTFASPQKINPNLETVKPGGLFSWSTEQTAKSLFRPEDSGKSSLNLTVSAPKVVENSLFMPTPNPSTTNSLTISPVVPSDIKPTLNPISPFSSAKAVENNLFKPTEIMNPSILKPSDTQIPIIKPPEPTIIPPTNQNLISNNQPTPVHTPSPQSAIPAKPQFTQPVEFKTVIENAQSNPFLNKSIVNPHQTSYKFGEVKSDPTPLVFTQIPQAKTTTDIEMDSFNTCEPKVTENNFQNYEFAPTGFQANFTPINVFPASAPVVSTGIFGANLPFNGQNIAPPPKSSGFNLGIISNQKRGRK